MFFSSQNSQLVNEQDALPNNDVAIEITDKHFVLSSSLVAPFAENTEIAYFAMGCFWGAERLFWSLPGVVSTAVGYQGGFTANATYTQVCTGKTGHAEAVMVVFDPAVIGYAELLTKFWENHQPTQGMRQGADKGTQYRSAIYCGSDEQLSAALSSASIYQEALDDAGSGESITTEITAAKMFYYAESEHQQYLAKNPQGYCGLGGSGICYPGS